MPKQSYAEDINAAKVMISGLKANAERVSKRGLESGFVAKLEALHESARSLDNEQEDLKAKLKTKTAALETKMDELGAMMSEAGITGPQIGEANRIAKDLGEPKPSIFQNPISEAIKKRDDTHKMAEANRAFAHYRY